MKREKFRKYVSYSPILIGLTAALFAVVIFSLPNLFSVSEGVSFALNVLCRAAVTVLAFIAAKACGIKLLGKRKISVLEFLLLLLGLAVCLNNFPIIGVISGNVRFLPSANVWHYVLYCAAIGVSEEAVFRGFIMPIVGLKFVNKEKSEFLTVLVSSAVFAFCHAFNVFSAGLAATALQVGYTFLTGGLFGAAFYMTKNLLFPACLHFNFDLGGLLFFDPFKIAAGNMWDTATIIITAALGLASTAAYSFKLFYFKSPENQK